MQTERFQELIQSFTKLPPLLVLGDVGIDKYSQGQVRRISPEAPVPIVEIDKEWFKLGLASNVSDNLHSLGVSSTLCGVVGDDNGGALIEELLEDRGLKTWGIVRDGTRTTTVKERIVTAAQQVCRVDYETRDELKTETQEKVESRIQEFASQHGALIIEDYGKGLMNQALIGQAIQLFREQKKLVIIDPCRETPPRWYQGASLLKPNRAEAEILVEALGHRGEKKVERLCEILVEELKLEKILITLGAEGMALLDSTQGTQVEFIPTMARDIFDVSGAGDTAVSVISACLMAGASLREAAWIGNCASGIVVGKKGTATVTPQELQDFF